MKTHFPRSRVSACFKDSSSSVGPSEPSSSCSPSRKCSTKASQADLSTTTHAIETGNMEFQDGSEEKIADQDDSEEKIADEKIASLMDITSIRMQELYHWCATVSVLLILQLLFDSIHHGFRCIPHPSEWCGFLLLLYCVAVVLAVYYAPGARPWAACILAMGSLLMTHGIKGFDDLGQILRSRIVRDFNENMTWINTVFGSVIGCVTAVRQKSFSTHAAYAVR